MLLIDPNQEEEYPIQYRTLNFAVSVGAKVAKVHSKEKIRHVDNIRKYIRLNTEKRANAKTKPGKKPLS